MKNSITCHFWQLKVTCCTNINSFLEFKSSLCIKVNLIALGRLIWVLHISDLEHHSQCGSHVENVLKKLLELQKDFIDWIFICFSILHT
jgi:hypothetical protein